MRAGGAEFTGFSERNLPDFHGTATLAQRPGDTLSSVALLTGRDHEDGLGGLRAVLFLLFFTSPGETNLSYFCEMLHVEVDIIVRTFFIGGAKKPRIAEPKINVIIEAS